MDENEAQAHRYEVAVNLRATMRATRRSFDAVTASRRAADVADRAMGLPWWATARRVAVYRAFDGEVDVGDIAAAARRRGATTAVPVVDGTTMQFVDDVGTEWIENRFGIAEPSAGSRLAPEELDLVFLPVVAVDRAGHRLGMGGGFYDRAFAWLRTEARPARTVLVAVAHDEQVHAAIEPNPWDIDVDAVITPTTSILVAAPPR